MNLAPWRWKVLMWSPAIWAAALLIMKQLPDRESGNVAFLSFVPLGFVFSASAAFMLYKRVVELEAELQAVRSASAVGDA